MNVRGQLLGLGGYAMAGKDAVADVLERDGWARTFMSRPLMQALLALDPLIPLENEGPVRYSLLYARVGYDRSKQNPEVRRLLQVLGTEVGRNMFGQDVWVDAMLTEVNLLREQGRNVVVTGIRFPNELAAVRAAGGTSAWVRRRDFGPVNAHVSDNMLSAGDFDALVTNDGTLADLADNVRALVSDLASAA